MPQEFLRDVLRTGDGAERRHRRLSILPLSIAGHAVVLGAFLISPWAGAIDLPVIASPFQGHYMETVPPPAPPAPSTPAQPAPRPAAPIEAPSEIGEEAPVAPSRPVEGGLIDGPGVSTGVGVLSDLSVGVECDACIAATARADSAPRQSRRQDSRAAQAGPRPAHLSRAGTADAGARCRHARSDPRCHGKGRKRAGPRVRAATG